MKKIMMTIAAATFALSATASIAGSELRIGVEGAYPPFSSKTATGELIGFDIDIAKALCVEMKRECKLVEQDWDGIIPALLAKKYDAIIASMSITEERKKKVDFSKKYYNTPAKFIGRKDAGLVDSLEGLKGKSVGIQRGTIHQNFMEKKFSGVTLKAYGTQDEVYLDLAAGRIDAAMADSVALDDGFLSKPEGKDFAFFGADYSDPAIHGEGAGVAVRKTDAALRDAFSAAIAAIRANGVYAKINAKYFDFDLYGG